MPFLGYILPPKNQKAYDRDVALAVKNYKNDVLSKALVKPAAVIQSQPIVMQTVKQESPQAIVNDVLNDIISSALKPAGKIETTSKASSAASRPTSPLVKASSSASRPTSPLVKELEAKLASPKLGLRSKNLTVDTTEVEEKPSPSVSATSSAATSPSGTEFTVTTQSTMADLLDQLQAFKDVNAKGKAVNTITRDLIKQLFKQEIKRGKDVYGARGGNQGLTEKNRDNLKLIVKDGQLVFEKTGRDMLDRYLNVALKINLGLDADAGGPVMGQGVKKTGVRKYNSEENFGKFNLSLKALRKGNLTIYRPSSNHVLINRKNISPRLIKMINEIRSKMKFELEDYDNLKKSEQMVIDQIINLLRMDYPPKMRRTLDEEVWNLKQRYEILISEINAGNDGKLVRDELKEVLAKLKELKVITKRKHDFIVKAIS